MKKVKILQTSKKRVAADAQYGSIVLDAKSFMGLISLGLGRKIQIRVHGEKNERFAQSIEFFKAS